MRGHFILVIALLCFGTSISFAQKALEVPPAQPTKIVTLEEVLSLAISNAESVRAVNQSIESLESEIKARDLLLSPTLTSELAIFKDQRQTVTSNANRRGVSGLLDLTLAKPFATGTTLSVNLGHDVLNSDNFESQRQVAEWEVRLSQSLWRDSFGRSTRLRHEGEAAELKSRRFEALLEKQRIITEIETAYWDLVLAQTEEVVRNENIKRSQTVESWTRKRMGRFAAEQTDLLQVQALLSQRQLEQIDVRNRIEIARNRLKQLIPNVQPEAWQLDMKSLEIDRQPSALLATGAAASASTPTRMDALATLYRAQQTRSEAERVSDQLKPKLDAYVSYGANGVEDSFSSSWERAGQATYPSARAGLLLSVELDGSLKNERRKSARLNADSEESRAQALTRESQLAWVELQRNLTNLRSQAKEARDLSMLQTRKANVERKRYEQGRTNALQLTTFEVDAAVSELNWYRVLALLRKAEATARLFAHEEN